MGSFTEQEVDLFEVPSDYALAHCVGNDFIMGAGIAVEFKKRFGHQQWLIGNSHGVGTTLLLSPPVIEKYVFYLVTKPYSKASKPSYENIEESLKDMFKQAKDKGINKIAMPKIGCGLDGKKWDIVKELIKKHQNGINVLICCI